MNFMIRIKYRGRIFFLTLIIIMAPWQQLYASITQFTDENGTIYISNITKDKAKPQNEDYNASGQHKNLEVVTSHEPTPSNIFPEPGGADALSSMAASQAPTPEP
jgi:hypothetical protein